MSKYLFIGERPSHQAIKIGATWQNGKLAAKQLHDALRMLNIDPNGQRFVNLWHRPGVGPIKDFVDTSALVYIAESIAMGYTVIGMGHLVSKALKEQGIYHLMIVHPAARGAIRRKDRYQAHVGSILIQE